MLKWARDLENMWHLESEVESFEQKILHDREHIMFIITEELRFTHMNNITQA